VIEPAPGKVALGPDASVVADPPALAVADLLGRWLGLPVRSPADATGRAVRLRLRPDERGFGDEGYELVVRPQDAAPDNPAPDQADAEIVLTAATPAGLVHAASTLRQLRSVGEAVPAGRVADRPRFGYRGLMLDVARHFFPVPEVLRIIDLACLHKLNHLHLHLSDDQGWRIAIDSWPRLASVGGATQVGGGPGGCYSQDDYRAIVAYAAARGITVVPEIDLPGHTNAVLAAYPELATGPLLRPGTREPATAPPALYTGIEVGFSTLDPANPKTYGLIEDVLRELATLTPGPYLHVGGDEVATLDPDGYGAIVTFAQETVAGLGKTPIGWHELAEAPLRPSTVVQYWGYAGKEFGLGPALAAGHRVILSPADRIYLDMKYGPDSRLGLEWAGHVSTAQAYDWDPATYLSTMDGFDEAAVLGVEGPLWTETVRSLADAEYLLLPRLAVTAEIGWAAPRRGWDDLRRRLAAQAPLWSALGLAFHRDPDVPWE